MSGSTSKLLRKISLKSGVRLKEVKRAYNELPYKDRYRSKEIIREKLNIINSIED